MGPGTLTLRAVQSGRSVVNKLFQVSTLEATSKPDVSIALRAPMISWQTYNAVHCRFLFLALRG